MGLHEIDPIREIFDDDELIERTLQEAVRAALAQHRREGRPAVEWRDGRVVWIPPEELPLDDGPTESRIPSPPESG